ncbi:MAG: hypothetical protein KIT00_10595 [Rhodospirillales bacterium]|nr:hypothetical protein [Rhodospirillales bacterium]
MESTVKGAKRNTVAEKPAPAVRADRGPSLTDRDVPGGKPWTDGHAVNIRVSIPLPFGRYYVALVSGKERRCTARRALDRKKHPLWQFGNVLFFGFVGTLIGLSFLAATQALIVLVFTSS